MALHTVVEHDSTHVKPYIDSVKQALANEVTTRAALGAHNLGDFQFISQTVNGVSYSVSNDKIVTCSGSGQLTAGSNIMTDFELKAGTYKFTGCPSGGNSSSTYRMTAYKFAPSYSNIGIDTGNGFEFTLSEDSKIRVYLEFFSGYTFSGNVVFKPMITLPNDTAPTYQPYAMTNRELTDGLANAKCVVDANGIVSVNADGTKTYSQLLDSLTTAFLAKLSSLPTGHYIVVDMVILGGLSTYRVENKVIFTNNTSSFALYGIYVSADNSNIITNFLLYSSTSGSSAVRYALTNVSTGTSIINKTNDVPTNDKVLIIDYTEYKSV